MSPFSSGDNSYEHMARWMGQAWRDPSYLKIVLVATHRAVAYLIPLQHVRPPGYEQPVARGCEAAVWGLDRW